MPKNPRLPALAATPPALPETQALFGPRPLIAGEDAGTYDDLLARVTRAVAPADILEQMWVRDVVDLAWDVLRLRRLKARLIAAEAPGALAAVLRPLLDNVPKWPTLPNGMHISPALVLARKWGEHDRIARKEVDALFASAGLTMDDVMAECLSRTLGAVERIDQLTAAAEARRNAALRELDRHRAAAANAARRTIDDVEDAEFEDVPPQDLEHQVTTHHVGRQTDGGARNAA